MKMLGPAVLWRTSASGTQSNLRKLRYLSWGIASVAGFLQQWAARFFTAADGTNYLDIATFYFHGDWHNAVNSYWSPFFSWLLALSMWIFHPNTYWESTFLHLVNFGGMLTALVCFEFFFRSFAKHGKDSSAIEEDGEHALPELARWTLGYGLFLSTTLFLLPATDTTPDIWISAFTYIVAGLILRIRAARGGWLLFALLGLTLALAYLTKAFYFPITFVFLLTAWIGAGNLRKTTKQAILALVIFFSVAGPWIFVLSRSRHRFTFGDAGRIAINVTVNQSWQRYFWQGEDGSGVPKHPVRQLLAHPRVFEFAAPIGGTYPPGFDEPYWLDGVKLHFNFRGPSVELRQAFGTFSLIWQIQAEYGVLLLALFIAATNRAELWKSFRQRIYLWAPPLIACASYSIVFIEFRYVAPFVLLLWLASMCSLLSLRSAVPRRFLSAIILAAFCVTGLKITKFAVSDLFAIRSHRENTDWEVAKSLQDLGLRPGDAVAGLSRASLSQWARLAGVKIVAEIPFGDENMFWMADSQTKQKIFRLLAGTGAKMVITREPPPPTLNEGWIQLGKTSFYGYPLKSQ